MTDFRKDVLRKLEHLEIVQRNQTELLNSILACVTNPVDKRAPSGFTFAQDYFPLKSLEAVLDLEKLLLENKSAFIELVRLKI